jgi:hypothetical protein
MNRVLGAGLLTLLASTGCAVDPSGLGPDRTEADLGTEVDMGMLDPPDARVPPDAIAPVDGFVAMDAFEPPDLCVAEAEICNGVDDDCNGMIDDGLVSEPCDGDSDGCFDGMSGCAGGTPTCVDDTPMAGDGCDGPDADLEPEGSLSCDAGGLVCTGDCTASAEVCDQRDNDCDGNVDEDGVCDNSGTSCTSYTYDGSVYLFCTEGDGGDDWSSARDECRSAGYELVQVDDTAELAFLRLHTGSMDWWSDARANTGDSDLWDDPSRWFWDTSGDPVDTALWDPGEPSGNGRCAYLRDVNDDLLDDIGCGERRQILCEAPILP